MKLVRLFEQDLKAAGGDIDILINIENDYAGANSISQKIKIDICDKIGEQKIDLFICPKDISAMDQRARNFYDFIKDSSVVVWKKL